jgi:hypothetical protein
VIAARFIWPALLLLPILLSACAVPATSPYGPSGRPNIATAPVPPVKSIQLSGVLSCTAHIDGKLPAATWEPIPFRLESDRLSGLYTFTDNFKHDDSMVFSGILTGQGGRVTATAVRADGSPNFTIELVGNPTSMTGQMMSGMSQRPVRSCSLTLNRT